MTDPKRSKITDEHKEEARLLRALWDRRSPKLTQAEFGEAYGLGNQANVGHYLHARSALNPKAAAAFARGLGCRIEDFSPRVARSLTELSAVIPASALGGMDATSVSSERITRYVSDVSQSLVEFARLLDRPQRTLFRGLMGDLLSNPEAFAFLDRDQVRALLSDNAFRDDPESGPLDPADPFTDVDAHSVTNEAEPTHRTERDGPAYSVSSKRRAPRAG